MKIKYNKLKSYRTFYNLLNQHTDKEKTVQGTYTVYLASVNRGDSQLKTNLSSLQLWSCWTFNQKVLLIVYFNVKYTNHNLNFLNALNSPKKVVETIIHCIDALGENFQMNFKCPNISKFLKLTLYSFKLLWNFSR